MASVVMLPSGRYRAFARVKGMKDAKVFDDEAQGLTWAQGVERRMKRGEWRPVPKGAANPEATLRAVATSYDDSDAWKAKGEKTRKTELGKRKRVLEEFGDRDVRTITSEDVRAFIRKRSAEKPEFRKAERVTGDTVRLEVAALSSLMRHSIDLKLIDVNPVRGVRRPKGSRRTRRLTDEEIGQLFDVWNGMGDARPYTFFRILFSALCRPGELAEARKEWLRHDPPQICLPFSKNSDPRNVLLTVGNYRLLMQHLEAQPDDCPYLFGTHSRDGKSWSPYNYRLPWDKARESSGLQDVVPHLSRHEGISRLFERSDLSDGQIAGLSGHRSSQSLWIYRHLRNEHQRGVVNALDLEVSHAIGRTATSAHPSEGLKPGQKLLPLTDDQVLRLAARPAARARSRAGARKEEAPALDNLDGPIVRAVRARSSL